MHYIPMHTWQLKAAIRHLRAVYARGNRRRVHKPPAGEQEVLLEVIEQLEQAFRDINGGHPYEYQAGQSMAEQ